MATEGKIKRYIGNIADDTKELFDEILDRQQTRPLPPAAGPATPVPAGAVTEHVAGVPGGAAATTAAVSDPGMLPQHIARLADTLEEILAALRAIQGAGDMAATVTAKRGR